MPRNNRHVDQERKKKDIQTAAQALFAEKGFDGTSMAAIAKEAGITSNTIYWYYPSKDDVLIAVINDVTIQGLHMAATGMQKPVATRILELIEYIEQPGSLMNTVHARVDQSEAIRHWHDRFHVLFEQLIASEAIRYGIDPGCAPVRARLLVYVSEGLLAHPHNRNERKAMIDEMLNLVGIPPGATAQR